MLCSLLFFSLELILNNVKFINDRFGFALTNLGDLNKDKYEDIAIGAPYEGKGAVYIYLGSKNGIIKTPSQVIDFLKTCCTFYF